MKNNKISLQVKSNIDFDTTINIMNPIYNGSNNATSKTIYKFDLSTEDFIGPATVELIYHTITNVTTIYSVAPLLQLSIPGVVNALNSLGILEFYYEGTIIYAFSDTIIPNSLKL